LASAPRRPTAMLCLPLTIQPLKQHCHLLDEIPTGPDDIAYKSQYHSYY
jgi:hypothetical protein